MSEIKPVAWITTTGYATAKRSFLTQLNWTDSEISPLYDESALAQARAEERERCAKVCEDEAELASLMAKADALNVAAGRIRALSDTDERTEK